MRRQILSQLAAASRLSTSPGQRSGSWATRSASSIAAANADGLAAIQTAFTWPYCGSTSTMGGETTGGPAAKYSGVLVGLMNRVASLRAKGIRATSQPER